MLIHITTILSFVMSIVYGLLVSPCPDVLRYEQRSIDEPDKWYGVITVGTDEDLEGVWLKITLDRRVDLLGNWFAEATSKDNTAFSIRNPQYRLAAGPPILIRFFVKFNPTGTVPSVKKILLNGKTVCPAKKMEPTEPTLHIAGITNSDEITENPRRQNDFDDINSSSQGSSSNNFNSYNRPQRPINEDVVNENPPFRNPSNGFEPNIESYLAPPRQQSGSKRSQSDDYGSSKQRTTTQRAPGRYTTQDPEYKRSPSNVNEQNTYQNTNLSPSISQGGPQRQNEEHSSNKNTRTTRRPSVRYTTEEPNIRSRNQNVESASNSQTRSTTTPRMVYRQQSDNRRPLSNTVGSNDGEDFFQGDFHIIASTKRPTFRPDGPSSSGNGGTVQCGTVVQRPSPLITHGQETSPGQWPWHAAMYIIEGANLNYICGGTLVSDIHVITAAHCVTRPRTSAPVQKTKLVIYLGKHSRISAGSEVQARQVEEIIINPEYRGSNYSGDIAIIKLDNAVEFTDYVRPCCLWEGDSNIERLYGQKGTIVGFGFNENAELTNKLMQSELPVVPVITCLTSNRDFFAQFISETNFCVGYRNDTNVCNGDSGGGLVFRKAGTSGQNTVWQLRGIVSIGVAKLNQGVCDPRQYSIFTDAAKYVGWIKETLRR